MAQSGIQPARTTLHFCAALLSLSLAGCLAASRERLHEYQKDGAELFARGEYAAARESYAGALDIDPDNANLLYNIGQCYDRQGKWDKAEEAYNLCLSRDPEHSDCRLALVMMLYKAGRKEDAQRTVAQWLEASPAQAAPYVADGWLLRQEGSIIDAQARVQQGLSREPRNVRALVEMAIIYEQLNWPARALTLYERALLANPKQPELTRRVSELRSQKVGRPLPN